MAWAALWCALAGETLHGAIEAQILYVRLLTPLSTRESRPGSQFTAEVTRPLVLDEAAAIPARAQVTGTVLEVRDVGLGLKRERGRLHLRFDEVVLPNGERVPLQAALTSVENAREELDRAGRIRGIRATHSLGDRMNVRLGGLRLTPFTMAYRSSMAAYPVPAMCIWFANGMIFGLTDPEIDYPAGTDMQLNLEAEWSHEARFPIYRGERPESQPVADDISDFLDRQPALSYFEKGGEADPVNLVFLGSPERAFTAAGWHGADEQRGRNTFRALRAVATARAYQRGPMTPLYLNGGRPVAEWQKSLNTYEKRHHLRMWHASETFDGETAWLVAATHDTGLRMAGARITHQVDRRIDRERERIVADLLLTGCVDSVTYIDRPAVSTRGWISDHRVAVVRLNACETPEYAPSSASPAKRSVRWRLAQRFFLNARNTILRENNAYRAYDLVRHMRQWRKPSDDHI